MKSFALISLFASAAWAFTAPAGLSTACGAYMKALDSDSSLSSCTSAINSATSAFATGSSSSGDVNSALSTLCASSNPCSEASIRTALTKFYAACPQELTNGTAIPEVVQIYDVLYITYPLYKSMCSQDDSGNRCGAQSLGTPPAASSLYTGSQQTLAPNFDTLKSSNAAFLFLQPTLSKDKLCVSCTRSILTSYISFESDLAYAPGLASSILLSGQTALYQAIQSTCGASFLNGAVQAAGSLADGILGGSSGAASIRAGNGVGTIASLLSVAAVALAAGF
ncbi:hypothetical protein BDY19DRAFT_986994 [Irpex rosettiformis]|uniref:Uncharacterized protein n=1 Tax=Irpex rosettiformis TaxID=378272 RepID=A0ACB8TUE0_9APHY|nr:hypothetical protein BDY19DRAFT_986994 [Irpex rosettiformis]